MFNKAFNLLTIRPSAFQEILLLVQTAKQGIACILQALMTGICGWLKPRESLQLPHTLSDKKKKNIVETTMQEPSHEKKPVKTQ